MKYRCIILLLISSLSNNAVEVKTVFPNHSALLPELEKGDWLFRQGTSIDSTLIRRLGNGQFSHIGIIIETDPIIILHATTDDDPTHPNQVIVSTLNQFFRPDLAVQFALVRPHFLTKSQRQRAIAYLKRQIGKPFLLKSETKPHRYCTTLIEQAIQYVEPTFKPAWKTITVPFFQGRYLFPEAFLHYPDATTLYLSKNVQRSYFTELNQ